MKVVQITDLHIDQKDSFPFDIDVRKNFNDILKTVRDIQPDHLVVSGDLCYRDGDEAIYKWIKNRLELQEFSYSVIAGNHDDSKLMAQVFKIEHLLTNEELFYAKKIGKHVCLFLDSGKGFHSENQLKWLKRQLWNNPGEIIIFMHHPPVKSGVPYMDDNHYLRDMEAIQDILFQHKSPVHIFCGHYHVEKTLRVKNLMIQITPSCFFQIDQNEKDFKVDHHQIALRIIERGHNFLHTTIRYQKGNFKVS